MKSLVLFAVLLVSSGSFAQTPASGFKLVKVDPGSIYEKLGLKNGDVIKKANGVALTSIDSFIFWLSQKKKKDKVDIVIERNGKEEALHYTIE